MLDHWSEAEEVRAEQSRGRYLENKLDFGFLSKKDAYIIILGALYSTSTSNKTLALSLSMITSLQMVLFEFLQTEKRHKMQFRKLPLHP